MLVKERERRKVMKKIEAIIRPDVFPDVRRALALEGIDGLSVTEIAGCGRQEGRTGLFRGNAYEMEFSAKLKLEMVVEESLVEPVIEAILEYAATGEVGDGKIFIFPVDEAIRIRTKERGAVAVY
jgi:nitrogen regulatory protein P-II 1